MIRNFKDKAAERLFRREFTRKVPPGLVRTAFRKLRMLHRSITLADLRVPPGNRLEKLSEDREGQHSIRINDQWRICFRWHDGDAYDVEIVDYHKGRRTR
ncbi:MAG: type II toxin-antitoxin system RelE/ParE family toxin [Thermodesulfobacteriota bacterium]